MTANLDSKQSNIEGVMCEVQVILLFLCVLSGACFCLADLPLTSNIEDDSCTRGAIVSSGSPVVFHSVPPLIDSSVIPGGHAGYFSGSGGETHLNVSTFAL